MHAYKNILILHLLMFLDKRRFFKSSSFLRVNRFVVTNHTSNNFIKTNKYYACINNFIIFNQIKFKWQITTQF